jgi:thioredoxin 1
MKGLRVYEREIMPTFDTPITANDASFERVLAQKLPILLYFFERSDEAIQSALERAASEQAGKLLIVKMDAGENPKAYARFERPVLPALLGVQDAEVKSVGAGIDSADIPKHIDYLLGRGPKPKATRANASQSTSASDQSVSSTPVHIRDASFQSEVLESPIPVLVDFWAPWCGPCHMIAPALEKLAQQYAGRIKIAKLNVDENQMSAGRYQVSGIPQLLMFKNGQQVGKLVGAHPQQNIERLIQQAL